jgi:alcohol dehydrogenase class IV
MNISDPYLSRIFFMPTKIVIGKGCIIENSHIFSSIGTKALIVTGKKSAKMNGSEKDVIDALKKRNIPYVIFDKAESNPSMQNARDAAENGKRGKADFVIGIGGGSPIDVAKVAAILARNDNSDEAIFSNSFTNQPLPIVAVPTTAGTGSEVTQYSMMTNDRVQNKSFVISQDIFPKVSFLDASYTEALPSNVTINTALDTLSHVVESYLSARTTEISSFIALEGMRILGECLPSLRNQSILEFGMREKLLYASMLGGIVISQTGTTAAHAMGYSLTYFRKIEHGRANGLLMYEYLKFLSSDFEEKVTTVIRALGLKSIEEFKDLTDELLGDRESISDEEISKFSSIAIGARNIPFTLKATRQDDLEIIYRKSFSY